MPYVERRDGRVVGLYNVEQDYAQEFLDDDHPEVIGLRSILDPVLALDPKMSGVEFEGVMCSATAADQAGLAAVLLAIQLQGAAFQPTRFYFENGNTLVITLANWQAFAATWLPFRQSFFAVP